MRQTVSAVLVAASCLSPASLSSAEDVKDPRSGVSFAAKDGSASLLGIGLRTRTMLKVKVYAIGLYVDDAALSGALAAHKGKTSSPEFYRDLVWGDFPKHVVLKFTRDVTTSQIQGAFREALPSANKARVDAFAAYFGDTKVGQEYVIRWAPGGVLETTVVGRRQAAHRGQGLRGGRVLGLARRQADPGRPEARPGVPRAVTDQVAAWYSLGSTLRP